MQEVRGPGVVGEQPILGPGESFSYTSGCPLPTRSGTMQGSYVMETENGRNVHGGNSAFFSRYPQAKRVVH